MHLPYGFLEAPGSHSPRFYGFGDQMNRGHLFVLSTVIGGKLTKVTLELMELEMFLTV